MRNSKKIRHGIIVALTFVTVASASFANESFKDVSDQYWAHDTITWGVTQNILQGYEDHTFKPNQTVTEAEFLTMLINTFVGKQNPVGTGKWYSGYYAFAKKYNWSLKGIDDSTKTAEKLSRGRVAEIVSGAAGVNYSGDNAIRYMLANDLSQGRTDKPSVKGYAGAELLTRAEAIQFIKNAVDHGFNEVKPRPTTSSDTTKLPEFPDDSATNSSNNSSSSHGWENKNVGDFTLKEVKKQSVTNTILSRAIGFMPIDKKSESFMHQVMDAIQVKDGIVTIDFPNNIPSGYSVYLVGENGSSAMVDVLAGETKTFKLKGTFGISMYVGAEAKQVNSISADGAVIWGAKHS
ncbi:S-layer homology domain-containing protein [Acinetobacter sp. CUI P1]|nr:S-layer homology domain-containing protein [Acinetobacter sp. CUI P1]